MPVNPPASEGSRDSDARSRCLPHLLAYAPPAQVNAITSMLVANLRERGGYPDLAPCISVVPRERLEELLLAAATLPHVEVNLPKPGLRNAEAPSFASIIDRLSIEENLDRDEFLKLAMLVVTHVRTQFGNAALQTLKASMERDCILYA